MCQSDYLGLLLKTLRATGVLQFASIAKTRHPMVGSTVKIFKTSPSEEGSMAKQF